MAPTETDEEAEKMQREIDEKVADCVCIWHMLV